MSPTRKPKTTPGVAQAPTAAPQAGVPTWLLVAIIAVGWLVWTGRIDLSKLLPPKGNPDATPVVVPDDPGRPRPAEPLAAAASAVRDRVAASPAKAMILEAFYAGTARVLRSSSKPDSVQGFRTRHRAALELLVASDPSLAGQPAIGDLVDAVFVAAIGDVPGPLDGEKAAQAADAIAWACWAARQKGG